MSEEKKEMKKSSSPAKDLTVGSPMKLILGFAFPMFLGLLFQQFYSLVDTMIVGKYLGETTDETTPSSSKAIEISGCDKPTDVSASDVEGLAKSEIGTNIGEKTPKLKYKKANKDEKASKCTATPGAFYALINAKGTVFVLIGPKETPTFTATPDKVGDYTLAYPICPESCGAYQ